MELLSWSPRPPLSTKHGAASITRKFESTFVCRRRSSICGSTRSAAIATVVEGEVSDHVVKADPADDIYIAAAADGLADYIVSGDRHLLDLAEYGGIRIVTPRTFLSILER